ncbi:MAG: Gfo/Idh/MocA family oxidoreductase [Armatimonadetes bacterium]|nr:Gfo/Idh/MocA family oxidoreductase [Armatimonadota bacterium]
MKIAYIGAGNFTNHYMFPQLARHGLELAAICDLDEGKAEAARQRYGFGRIYTDFRKMLETERPQAVFCVGGPKVHYSVGLEVLDRGFPLYVQKSPAPSSASTREMSVTAERKGVVCHVGFNLRSAPAVRQARAAITSDEFGRPLMGVFRYGLTYGATMADVVMDQHCHMTDLARFLMGGIRSVKVIPSGLPEARDYVAAVQFHSGAVGTLNFTSGQIIEKEFLYFEVTGEGTFLYSHECASLVWNRPFKGEWWQSPRADYVYRHGAFGGQVGLETLGYIGDVASFIAAVKGEAEDISPISSAIGTMELCEAILRQIEERV